MTMSASTFLRALAEGQEADNEPALEGGLQGYVSTLSCPTIKTQKGEPEPRPEKVPRVRARATRAKS